MRNIFVWCLVLLALTTACAQQDKTQSDVITKGKGPEPVVRIQGVPVDVLQNKTRSLRDAEPTVISPEEINFWVGSGSNKAALVVKFNDGIAPTAMVWGYLFDADSVSSYQMLTDIAKANPRMQILTQYQGISYGYEVGWGLGAIGFNHAEKSRFAVTLDVTKAEIDSNIKFHYTGEPNDEVGQTAVPANPSSEIRAAVNAGIQTGVIEHPFNYTVYGYPAYDFDYWTTTVNNPNKSWQAGWYKAYWTLYTKDSWNGIFDTAPTGISFNYVKNGSVDGLYFCTDPSSWPCGDMYGPYTYVSKP